VGVTPVLAAPAGSLRGLASLLELRTELHVQVIDMQEPRADCEGIAPRRAAVDLDGREVDVVEIPCPTMIVAPPPSFDVEVGVPPGLHTLRVRDLSNRLSTVRSIQFPRPYTSFLFPLRPPRLPASL
jgi:hypothetical protein